MHRTDPEVTTPPARLMPNDWLFALALCVVLQCAWAIRDWTNLSALHLPDTDDMMRLQQIRDWLGGQSWFDLTQHRLGLGDGLPMHWTRVNDLIPALIISVVTPFAGAHNAELAAVLIGPALLFCAFLLLSARAALSLGGQGTTKIAILVAAFAYPTTGMFIPGRIDHHALQIVLLLGAVTAALVGIGSPLACSREGANPESQTDNIASEARLPPAPEHKDAFIGGVLAGAACALSIVVGLETVPQMAALMFGLLAMLVIDKRYRHPNAWLQGFLGAVALSMLLCAISYGGRTLDVPTSCDAMSPMLAIACGLGALSLLSLTYPTALFRRYWWRVVPGSVAVAGLSFAFAASLVPVCRAGPYGQVAPFLMRVWMAHVGEAQGLLHQPSLGIVWGYCALVLVALGVAGAAVLGRRPEPRATHTPEFRPAPEHANPKPTPGLRPAPEHAGVDEDDVLRRARYLIIAAPLAMSVLVMLFQLRGAYIGAGLAAPILAAWLSSLRARGGGALIGAALLSAGVVHSLIGARLDALVAPNHHNAAQNTLSQSVQNTPGKTSGSAGCSDVATLAALNQLPPARIMAPMDAGAYIIGATPHHVFAAPYHRNNAGNLVMYAFFLAPPDTARTIAKQFNVNEVLICADSFSEINGEPGYTKSLVAALKSGHAPLWLAPVGLRGTSAMLYRIRDE